MEGVPISWRKRLQRPLLQRHRTHALTPSEPPVSCGFWRRLTDLLRQTQISRPVDVGVNEAFGQLQEFQFPTRSHGRNQGRFPAITEPQLTGREVVFLWPLQPGRCTEEPLMRTGRYRRIWRTSWEQEPSLMTTPPPPTPTPHPPMKLRWEKLRHKNQHDENIMGTPWEHIIRTP